MDFKRGKFDFENMEIYFDVTEDVLGRPETFDLIPGGGRLRVSKYNVLDYARARADFHLNKQLKHQWASFFDGLSSIINPMWLRLFSADELQILISGSPVCKSWILDQKIKRFLMLCLGG